MNNNFIWNLGHVVVSQQKLVYALSGLPMHILDSLFEKYQNGSRPDGKLRKLKSMKSKLLSEMVETTKADFEAGIFKRISSFLSNQNWILFRNIKKKRWSFNNYHEGFI